jgi:uncharacterized membrane protein
MSAIPGELPRWRRIALPASIILNLFLIAVIGGHLLKVDQRYAAERMPLARALARAEQVLSPQDAAAFGAVFRREAPRLTSSNQHLREARQELERQIVADPFNPTATRQALQATQVALNHYLDDIGAPLVEALGQVSPQGRRKLIMETQFGARNLAEPAEPEK